MKKIINFLLNFKGGVYFDEVNQQYYYKCPKCGIKSYAKKDIQYRYCGRCHEFNI